MYSGLENTFTGLSGTGYYMDQIVSGISPTINFMYDHFLTNPFIIVLILVVLVLSLFTFGSD